MPHFTITHSGNKKRQKTIFVCAALLLSAESGTSRFAAPMSFSGSQRPVGGGCVCRGRDGKEKRASNAEAGEEHRHAGSRTARRSKMQRLSTAAGTKSRAPSRVGQKGSNPSCGEGGRGDADGPHCFPRPSSSSGPQLPDVDAKSYHMPLFRLLFVSFLVVAIKGGKLCFLSATTQEGVACPMCTTPPSDGLAAASQLMLSRRVIWEKAREGSGMASEHE